jgi:hypothetical protein
VLGPRYINIPLFQLHWENKLTCWLSSSILQEIQGTSIFTITSDCKWICYFSNAPSSPDSASWEVPVCVRKNMPHVRFEPSSQMLTTTPQQLRIMTLSCYPCFRACWQIWILHSLYSLLFSHTFHFYTFAIISRFSSQTPRIPTKAKAKVKTGRGRHPTIPVYHMVHYYPRMRNTQLVAFFFGASTRQHVLPLLSLVLEVFVSALCCGVCLWHSLVSKGDSSSAVGCHAFTGA